ncbi:MAG: hypothetical protein ACREKL_04025 [Chthoniobacterales bacterium]
MKIARRNIDDLKTERPDITPSLQPALRLVPILFYVVIVGGIALSAFFFILLRNAASAEQQAKAETADLNHQVTEVQASRESIEQQARRASEVVAWVEGSRSLQPLVVGMIRSMAPASSIADLTLDRDPATPSQIKLALKLNAQGTRQLDTTLAEITTRNFRSYNPNQTQTRGEVDYEATLIHQNARGTAVTPISNSAKPQ